MPHSANLSHNNTYSPLISYLKSLTETLKKDSQETLALKEHLYSLAEIAEESNLPFTGYFLEKAAESIIDLDDVENT